MTVAAAGRDRQGVPRSLNPGRPVDVRGVRREAFSHVDTQPIVLTRTAVRRLATGPVTTLMRGTGARVRIQIRKDLVARRTLTSAWLPVGVRYTSSLAPGRYSLVIRAWDRAGNRQAGVSRGILVVR